MKTAKKKLMKTPPKLTKSKADWQFWHGMKQRNLNIFHKVLEGKTAEDITAEFNLYPDTVMKLMDDERFKTALQTVLNNRLQALQILKIKEQIAIFKRLGMEFSARLEEAGNDTVVKEYLKMVFAKVEKTEISAQFIKVLNQTVQLPNKDASSEESTDDVRKYFDVESVPFINGTTDTGNNSVAVREEVEDEQGEPDRIQRSQVSMGVSSRSESEDSSEEMYSGGPELHNSTEDPLGR